MLIYDHEQPKCVYKKGQMLNEKLDIKEIEFLDIEKFCFFRLISWLEKEEATKKKSA